MIDWRWVVTNSVWVIGLALVLASASLGDQRRRARGLPLRHSWPYLFGTAWARGGAALACAGFALGGASWLERTLWALLGADTLYRWWRARGRSRDTADAAAADTIVPTPAARRQARMPRWLRVGATWCIAVEPLLLALAAPLFLFPAPERAQILLLLPALAVARRVARGRFFPRTPLDWPLALLAFMILVSLYATFDLRFSLGKIAGLLYGLAWFYAAVEWLGDRRRLAWAVAAYALAGTALAALALVGTRWGNKLPGLAAISRHLPQRLLDLPGAEDGFQPNQVGGALLWIVPPLLALGAWLWFAARGTPRRWPLAGGTLAALLPTGGTLALTQSRSALLGLLAGIVLLGAIAVAARRRVRPAAVLVGIAIAAAVAATIAIGPARIAARVFPASAAAGDAGLNSLDARAEIWSRAIYGLQDFPFTGMGMNNFRRVAPILYPFFTLAPTTDIAHAHNQLLQAGLDLGVPGLIAYLALWFGACALVYGALRGARGWLRALVAGIGAALLASFVFGLTDAIALGAKPGIFFWLLLALLVASWRLAGPRAADPAVTRTPGHREAGGIAPAESCPPDPGGAALAREKEEPAPQPDGTPRT